MVLERTGAIVFWLAGRARPFHRGPEPPAACNGRPESCWPMAASLARAYRMPAHMSICVLAWTLIGATDISVSGDAVTYQTNRRPII
jgi:hypothetical protein